MQPVSAQHAPALFLSSLRADTGAHACNYVAMMSSISCTGGKLQRRVIRKCWKVLGCVEY